MDPMKPARPATRDDVLEIVGKIDDDTVARIIATGATPADVLEANTWMSSDDYLHRALHHVPHGTVGEICGILEEVLRPPEDPTRRP